MSRIDVLHRSRLEAIATEAGGIAGTASRIAAMAGEALDKGGTLTVAAHMAYIVGAVMRLQKDLGVTEQLQSEGAHQRRRIVA